MRHLALFRPRARRTPESAPPAPQQALPHDDALARACALPEPERRALVYVTLAGLSYAQIARLMEVDQPDVRRLISQAREHLSSIGTRHDSAAEVPS